MLDISIKTYNQLTKAELYDMLQLRSEVFVVEQDCVYQDIDGRDQIALHVLGFKDHKLVAYTRCFKPDDYFEAASIGRVVVKQSERQHNFGNVIMKASIDVIKQVFKTSDIVISAQTYLNQFYTKLSFEVFGEEYLEDGIPHIRMRYIN